MMAQGADGRDAGRTLSREQLLQRSLVSPAPVSEQLGDLLSRGWGRCHRSCSTPQSLTWSEIFYSTVGRIKKNCGIVAGFTAPLLFSALTAPNKKRLNK